MPAGFARPGITTPESMEPCAECGAARRAECTMGGVASVQPAPSPEDYGFDPVIGMLVASSTDKARSFPNDDAA